MKHRRKRWVRRQRHKQPSLIAMHYMAEYLGIKHPLIFSSMDINLSIKMLQ
jgi:hypothetical protein